MMKQVEIGSIERTNTALRQRIENREQAGGKSGQGDGKGYV